MSHAYNDAQKRVPSTSGAPISSAPEADMNAAPYPELPPAYSQKPQYPARAEEPIQQQYCPPLPPGKSNPIYDPLSH